MAPKLPMACALILGFTPLALAGDGLESALTRAGENRGELESALAAAPEEQRAGLEFLIEHMPPGDLTALSGAFLLEHLEYAYLAWDASPWKAGMDPALFLNNVLPYASINERRDAYAKDFHERFAPLVKDARTPAEAAAILNNQIFATLGVKYSTARPKADQSPYESMEAGMASCTGLSVLLIDACRSVGVPARFVGTARWSDDSGNHSWVEIWDEGWHFTGAAEPTGDDLDRAWFSGRASGAKRGDATYGIFATSFQRTPLRFPMVWQPDADFVFGVDVTDRYTGSREPAPAGKIDHTDPLAALGQYLAQPWPRPAPANDAWARVALTEKQARRAADRLRGDHAEQVRRTHAKDFEARIVRHGEIEMPYEYKVFGKKPRGGRSLWISMHGGGGAPASVNDQQWENQKRLYELKEGVYLAPRAPTDTWNLWHQGHIDPLFDRIITDMVVFEGVNPDRVYVLGYSAGGDGVFQLAPRMADRWAAAGMMAGHPNETRPDGLRNLAFTLHVGGEDGAYDRNKVAREWQGLLADLHAADPGGYQHWVEVHGGKGHWMDRLDAAALPWMAQHTRDLRPERIVWLQDDVVHPRFYWLAVDAPTARSRIVVERVGQEIRVLEADGIEQLTLRLDDAMLDLDAPVTVRMGERILFEGHAPRTIATLMHTLAERGDPRGMWPAELLVVLRPDKRD